MSDTVTGRSGQKVLSFVVVAGLLVSTPVAFVITERLKLVRSPIFATVVSKVFSPSCACSNNRAWVSFDLRRSDVVTVEVVTTGGHPVRLLAARSLPLGFHRFDWEGRDRTGAFAPAGSYKVRVHLRHENRTIVLPNVIQLDVTPPVARVLSIRPRRIMTGERLRISYLLSEPAHPLLFVDGRLAIRGRWPYARSSIDWYGKIGGRPVRPGVHYLTLRARDLAGNISNSTAPARIVVRRHRVVSRQRHKP